MVCTWYVMRFTFFLWPLSLYFLVGLRLKYLLIFLRVYWFISYSSYWGTFSWYDYWFNEFSFLGKPWVDNITTWYEGSPLLIWVTHPYWTPPVSLLNLFILWNTPKTIPPHLVICLKQNYFSLILNQIHLSIIPQIFDAKLIVIPTWINKETLVAKNICIK